ncbi:MAG: hypothetical protein RMM10_13440, partial [Anaerolineae bacterium]|uniref:hypothetical protein n=1 Tax=Thermoflexus sp. TaxID=1969742 RepID=UPI0025D8FDA0
PIEDLFRLAGKPQMNLPLFQPLASGRPSQLHAQGFRWFSMGFSASQIKSITTNPIDVKSFRSAH